MFEEYKLDGVLQHIAYNVLLDCKFLGGTEVGLQDWLASVEVDRRIRHWAGIHCYTDNVEFLCSIIFAAKNFFAEFNDVVNSGSSSWQKNTWALAESWLVKLARHYTGIEAYKRQGLRKNPWQEPVTNSQQLWFGREEMPVFAFSQREGVEVRENKRNDLFTVEYKPSVTVRIGFQGELLQNEAQNIVDLAYGERQHVAAYAVGITEYAAVDDIITILTLFVNEGIVEIMEPGNARSKALLSELSVD